jgi:hypothetical protein
MSYFYIQPVTKLNQTWKLSFGQLPFKQMNSSLNTATDAYSRDFHNHIFVSVIVKNLKKNSKQRTTKILF